jgi:hypothetical protein
MPISPVIWRVSERGWVGGGLGHSHPVHLTTGSLVRKFDGYSALQRSCWPPSAKMSAVQPEAPPETTWLGVPLAAVTLLWCPTPGLMLSVVSARWR